MSPGKSKITKMKPIKVPLDGIQFLDQLLLDVNIQTH